MAATVENGHDVPLSPQAQDAKESMQRQLLRTMANKMYASAVEEERKRRVEEMQKDQGEDSVKMRALESLTRVQEDMVRAINVMKVKAELDLEQAQRVTENKKHVVHDELVRKSAAKEADMLADQEKQRRIAEDKEENSAERNTVYSKLMTVQEDLLKTLRKMQADQEGKIEQQRRIQEGAKLKMQEQLVHSVGEKTANSAMDKEKTRRTEEPTEEEYLRRENIAYKMIDVQKELLATQKPVKPIGGTTSQEVLEEAKAYVQEQIRRKAAQKEAIILMDEEQKRRVSESTDPRMSDAQVDVLEAITRQAGVKMAKDLVASAQQEYLQADLKALAQEHTVRKINQIQADRDMDKEKTTRVQEQSGKETPHISDTIKQEIQAHSK